MFKIYHQQRVIDWLSVASRYRRNRLFWPAAFCTFLLLCSISTAWGFPVPQAQDKRPNAIVKTEDDTILDVERSRLRALNKAESETREKELLSRRHPAVTKTEELWQGFRKVYPFHIQVVALSDKSHDGSQTLIVSEPPPHLTVGEILTAIGAPVLHHQVKTHDIGYKGWVKDLVVAIKASETELAKLLSTLSLRVFHTSYKQYVLDLPATAQSSHYDLDLQISAHELKNWIVDKKEKFSPVEGGKALSFLNLPTLAYCRVYLSSHPGLVSWWIPKDVPLENCLVQIRQFSIDSDLIVGAVANARGVLILARKRMTPVEIVPPLRTETLLLLAAVQRGQQGELHQSYERLHPLAGRLDQKRDWAPILLSPVLRDTEYGSLLNITDQLLKSWSNNGGTKYFNFDYADPSRWPFPSPLPQYLKASTLTYNWNTTGVGYTVDFGRYQIYALGRTGALHISYIPQGRQQKPQKTTLNAEDTAYNYFARQSDPNLVRVVQYAALYQIFSVFNITASPTLVRADTFPDTALEALTRQLVAEVRQASQSQLSRLTQVLASRINDLLVDEIALQRLIDEQVEAGNALCIALSRGASSNSPEEATNLRACQAIVQTNIEEKASQLRTQILTNLQKPIRNTLRELGQGRISDRVLARLTLSILSEVGQIPERYSNEVEAVATGWIHTPVVVLSWNRGEMSTATGGHNLAAKVGQFKPNDAFPRTNPRISRNKIDAPGGSSYSYPSPPSHGAGWGRRFSSSSSSPGGNAHKLTEHRKVVPGILLVDRKNDGRIYITHSDNTEPIEVSTAEDAADFVASLSVQDSDIARPVTFDLNGFQEHEAAAFARTVRVRLADERIPTEISAFLSRKNHLENLEQLKLARRQLCDFSSPKVSEPRTLTEPNGLIRGHIAVEVPAVDGRKGIVRIFLEHVFRMDTPHPVVQAFLQKVRTRILSIIAKWRGPNDSLTLSLRLHDEIHKMTRESALGVTFDQLRLQIHEDAGDVQIMQWGSKNAIAASVPATCPAS